MELLDCSLSSVIDSGTSRFEIKWATRFHGSNIRGGSSCGASHQILEKVVFVWARRFPKSEIPYFQLAGLHRLSQHDLTLLHFLMMAEAVTSVIQIRSLGIDAKLLFSFNDVRPSELCATCVFRALVRWFLPCISELRLAAKLTKVPSALAVFYRLSCLLLIT